MSKIENEKFFSCHNHLSYSNCRIIDSTNRVDKVIDRAVELGYKGMAFTDHEFVGNGVDIIQYVQKGKEEGNIPKEFKYGLGNEIYLVNSLEEVRDNYEGGVTKLPHFVLIAKDIEGHKQLRELSSLAWENSFRTGLMERVPTVKEDMKRIVRGGHVIGSSSCIGGELPQLILKLDKHEREENDNLAQEIKIKIHKFVTYCIEVFGREDFYFELQPHVSMKDEIAELDELKKDSSVNREEIEKKKMYHSMTKEQHIINHKLVELAKAYGLKWIVTTDSHYLRKEDDKIHEAYLNSKDGDREVAAFYRTTYLMDIETIEKKLLEDIESEDIRKAFKNTIDIYDDVEEYDLFHPVIVPEVDLPEFEVEHIFKESYSEMKYIESFAHSDYSQDRYLLYLIENGYKQKESNVNDVELQKILKRIDVELGELWEITDTINTKLSSYYVTTREIVNIIWEKAKSLVGVARGSVGGFYICYLIDIIQTNPMEWDLPHWRHLTKSRAELPKQNWALTVNSTQRCA